MMRKKRKTIQLPKLDQFFWLLPSTYKEAAPQPSTSSFIEEQQEEEEKEKSPKHVSNDDDSDADNLLPIL